MLAVIGLQQDESIIVETRQQKNPICSRVTVRDWDRDRKAACQISFGRLQSFSQRSGKSGKLADQLIILGISANDKRFDLIGPDGQREGKFLVQ